MNIWAYTTAFLLATLITLCVRLYLQKKHIRNGNTKTDTQEQHGKKHNLNRQTKCLPKD